ncbi:MAG: sugar ABC transporter substrate-binding protein [Spirochaetaceae bacterium]
MKKLLVLLLAFMVAGSIFANGNKEDKPQVKKIVWYASAVHPYFDSVQKGVEAFSEATGIEVKTQIGPDWTQDSQTQNVEALAANGYNGFSIYPSDPSGANGLYEELTARGNFVVNFGTSTVQPTTASFAIATDVKYAAMVATEKLIELMGGKGNILNVLEVVTDANTVLRKEGIEEVVAKYPDVNIVQEIGDMTSIEEGMEKIENAMAANLDVLDGVICTGYTTTVAATAILSPYNQNNSKRISFVGIDDDPAVLEAIRNGSIDATIAQNPYGHGYLSCQIISLLLDGYTPRANQYFINAGLAVVTKENIDTFSYDLSKVTTEIVATLTEVYLEKK